MKPALLIGLVVVLFYVFAGSSGEEYPDETPAVPDLVVPADAPNFTPLFQSAISQGIVDRATAKQHAQSLSNFTMECGDILDFDGAQEKPQIDTARKFIAMRTLVRHFKEKGGSYTALYPELGPALLDYLDRKVGRDDKEDQDDNTMTPERRRLYVDAYRAGLGPAFLRTSKEL